jgi:hypothetical protein
MTRSAAQAETFFAAFKALPKAEREHVLARFIEDRGIREDLIDLAIVAERQGEKSQPFRECLADRESRR